MRRRRRWTGRLAAPADRTGASRPGSIARAVEELARHVELATSSARRQSGLDEREARRQALAELGPASRRRGEQIAEGRTGFALEQADARSCGRRRACCGGRRASALLSIANAWRSGIGASAMLFALDRRHRAATPCRIREPGSTRSHTLRYQPEATWIGRVGAASGNIDDWRRRAGRVPSTAWHGLLRDGPHHELRRRRPTC